MGWEEEVVEEENKRKRKSEGIVARKDVKEVEESTDGR